VIGDSPRRLRRSLATAIVAAVSLLAADKTATPATAKPRDPVLKIVIEGSGAVLVRPMSLSCRETCTFRVPPGIDVTLTATSRLVRWSGACFGAIGDTCILQPRSNTTARASFEEQRASEDVAQQVAEPDNSPARLFNRVDSVLEQLPTASVAFSTPEKLDLREETEVELLLSLQHSVEQLKRRVAAVGRGGAKVRISDEMEARLTGLGFEIEAVTSERQIVSRSRVTEWKWVVEPTRTGVLHLHLTLTALVTVNGERSARSIRTFERTLTIRVTWQDRVTGFLAGNWQWLWTAIAVPVALWVIRRRRRETLPAQ
jgi:hypothetical protein